MEKELVKIGSFMFYCSELSLDTFKELGEEILIINPNKEDVTEAYRLIRQYLIPFATILDKDDEVAFVIVNSGDKDIAEITEFANRLNEDKTKWSISEKYLSEYYPGIKGYRIASSTYQVEKLTLQGEILLGAQKNVHPILQDMVKLNQVGGACL